MTQKRIHITGHGYEVLRVGPFWFLPWLTRAREFGPYAWHSHPNKWRTPVGTCWSTERVVRWARKENGASPQREYFTPKLIHEGETAHG